jgi:hypothetical protein
VFLILFPFFATFDLADKNLQMLSTSSAQSDTDDSQITVKFGILINEYQKMFDQSLSKSKDLDAILGFLPGVVVQERMGIQEMVVLYRIKPDLLKRIIKFIVDPLKPFHYILDDYVSLFLQDRDRSQLYYCDPMLQHITICRLFLFLLDQSNASPTGNASWWVFQLI